MNNVYYITTKKRKIKRKIKYILQKVDIMNKKSVIPDVPAIGANLHKERRRRQLSLAELAASSGISKAMLSQIESDKVNPTIATMWKIAHALNIELETLITGTVNRTKKFDVLRKEDIISLSTDKSGAVFHVLSPSSMAEELELYRLEMAPGCIHKSQAHAKGTEEFLNILEGRVKVSAGEACAILEKGDFIMFQSDVDHAIENLADGKTDLFMVVRFVQKER